jgi:putative N6-adenine-specific DNA methylase
MPFNILITCRLGLESVLKEELNRLGFRELIVANGEIAFKGDATAIVKCNLWLRTAERVFIELARFPAMDFDELFEGVSEIEWGDLLSENGKICVMDKCLNSKIMSGRTVQSITKKAIVESLKAKYKIDWLAEDGAEFKIHVNIIKDQTTVLMDSSGVGLHKRGYRAHAGEAPLRETIAAAMIILSGWKPDMPLFDPLCGAGTIPIEAALIGANIAPGFYRSFACEDWPFIDKKLFKTARKEAEGKIKPSDFLIHASDIDEDILETAISNSKKAGIGDLIDFTHKSVEDFTCDGETGMVITNPPYGERLPDVQTAEGIYKILGDVFKKQKGWSYFTLSPHPEFEKLFGRKANKNRKIYNGKIRCYFYSFS